MNIFHPGVGIEAGIYGRFNVSEMILRDHLAADRTLLANQTTFLAYIRTALTFFVAGITFIRFFDVSAIEIVGWAFIPASVLTFWLGLFRYRRLRTDLEKLRRT